MSDNIQDTYWQNILDDVEPNERPNASDIDTAIGVSGGRGARSDACFVRLKNGLFMFLERHEKSESIIIAPRDKIEQSMDGAMKTRLGL